MTLLLLLVIAPLCIALDDSVSLHILEQQARALPGNLILNGGFELGLFAPW